VVILNKKGTREMSFDILTESGMRITQWFTSIDELLKSILANPKDRYWRNT